MSDMTGDVRHDDMTHETWGMTVASNDLPLREMSQRLIVKPVTSRLVFVSLFYPQYFYKRRNVPRTLPPLIEIY